MGRTLADIIDSESPEVVQLARTCAAEQLVYVQLTKLLSNMPMDDVFETDSGVIDSLLTLKKFIESHGGKLCLSVYMPDGSHHSITV